MNDGSSYDEFPCSCEAANYRGLITGRDWSHPELWERYEGSPYLERVIDRWKRFGSDLNGFLVSFNDMAKRRRTG